jgi:hypothetical protein
MRTFTITTVFILLSLAPMALAATSSGGNSTTASGGNTGVVQNTTLINPLGVGTCSSNGTCLESFLNSILQFVVRIGSIVVILMLVYIGFLYVIAQGKPAELTKAHNALMWTVVGALILLGAQAISLGIQATVQAISVGK